MRIAKSLLCTSLLALLCGCPPARPPALAGAGMDMFTPVRVRLHPLSRLVAGTGATGAATAPSPAGPAVEARLEFTDQFGDIGKSAGTAEFELFAPGVVGRGEKLATWSQDINSPEANRAHWDAITRTYLFHLPLPPGAAPRDRSTLSLTFTLSNGQRLVDSLSLSSH